jgi:uncharacterized integral membrane protein
MVQLAILFGLAVAIGAVAFALQNNVPVTVTFLMWRFDSALAMVLLLSVALGALIVALLSTPAVLRLQWKETRQRKQIATLEQANSELRREVARLAAGAAPEDAATTSQLAKMAPRRP